MHYVKYGKSRLNFSLIHEFTPAGEKQIKFWSTTADGEMVLIKSWSFQDKEERDKALDKLEEITGCIDLNSDDSKAQTGFV